MAGWGDGVNTEVAGERVPDKGRAGTLERGGQMMCLRRARRAAWQHSASLCINFVYSQGWSKGTDGKKIGFKEGTDAPASGSSVNLLASGLHAGTTSSSPRQSRPGSLVA